VAQTLAAALQSRLIEIVVDQQTMRGYDLTASAIGQRRLANKSLSLLSLLDATHWLPLAECQFDNATNMTDRMGALTVLCSMPGASCNSRLEQFYERFQSERLVVDKWFAVQASAEHDNVLDDVISLTSHPAFEFQNPNRLRSLVGAFAMNNPVGFHREDGRGYKFLTDYIIKIDSINPQIAARLVTPLIRYRQFTDGPSLLMRRELERVAAVPKLSTDVYELVAKSLG
jgi:aminopeptidase N